MKGSKAHLFFIFLLVLGSGCKKNNDSGGSGTGGALSYSLSGLKVDGVANGFTYKNVGHKPVLKFSFSAPIDHSSVTGSVSFKSTAGTNVAYSAAYENNDSTVSVQPAGNLDYLSQYTVNVSTALQSKTGGKLQPAITVSLITGIDSTDKFSRISDDSLLTLVQQRTFKYFWNFGHPISGMARERNTSGDVVTTGGTGFGIMAIITGINRGFISREEGLQRIQTITSFLKNNCTRYHGAFAHWINGASGATVPFSTQDDGGDLVETSFLLQGLLCARQYFNTADAADTLLRSNINELWNGVEWNWFRQNNQQVLYWHWSPDFNFAINLPIHGWDEALMPYVLGASSNTDSIPKSVYDNGWAQNGAMKNGKRFYNTQLPLGPDLGGPLFFAHYSFLGINPKNLTDAYANYWTQNVAHATINYNYCTANPKGYTGYSNQCWGLTASDDNVSGYAAHAPDNDIGVISPTAAIASLPYTPDASLAALRFFYYKLGDKIWKDDGFTDAFNLTNIWFADSFLAIDQGPEIVMIENYRSGLLWNLFMSCPEIKRGMHQLGFTSPYL